MSPNCLVVPFFALLLLAPPLSARPGGRRSASGKTALTTTTTHPACSRALFPLPTPLRCGPNNIVASLSPTLRIQFSKDSHGLTSDSIHLAINRTLSHLKRLPTVITRGTQAEPGIGALDITALSLLTLTIQEEDNGTDKQLSTDESYTLTLDLVPTTTTSTTSTTTTTTVVAALHAATIYGALYGLSTFVNLFTIPSITTPATAPVVAGLPIYISDSPRFPWRGLLLDTANHYFPLADIYRTIDAMFSNKYNILHWHLVDSYSFPFASATYPHLQQGAWTSKAIYTPTDVAQLKRYAMVQVRTFTSQISIQLNMPAHTIATCDVLFTLLLVHVVSLSIYSIPST